MIKEFIRNPFVILSCALAIVLLMPLFFTSKGDVFLWINARHDPLLDIFFKYITHLGNGVWLALLLVFFLFYKYYFAVVTMFSILFQSILVSVFKRWLFVGLPRPVAFFGDEMNLNLVNGVDVHMVNTFPSGHSTTAFSLFALLAFAFAIRNTWLSVLFFILAVMVGVSRIYLAQHFFIDVYAGACFGLISVLGGIVVTQAWLVRNNSERLQGSVLKRK